MSETRNLVYWPDFPTSAAPPKDTEFNSWLEADDRGDSYQITVTSDGTEFYGHVNYTAKSLNVTINDALMPGPVTVMVDAHIDLGVTVPVHSTYQWGASTALVIGSMVGTGARELYTFEDVPGADMDSYLMFGGPLYASGQPTGRFYGLRISPAPLEDDLGVFSGATAGDETVTYSWSGEAYNSESIATSADEPTPEPSPGAGIVASVMTLLNLDGDDPEEVSKAQIGIDGIRLLVKGYTRGRGFKSVVNDDETVTETVAEDILAVIMAASLRFLANPSGLTYRAGSEMVTSAFNGWTLAELFVLNNYRKRWA